LTTATEHTVGDEIAPLAGYSQLKLVQKNAQACQQLHEVEYKKIDGACPSSRKMIILSNRKATAEPDVFFRLKAFADYVT
jgi:hypothetical protein